MQTQVLSFLSRTCLYGDVLLFLFKDWSREGKVNTDMQTQVPSFLSRACLYGDDASRGVSVAASPTECQC